MLNSGLPDTVRLGILLKPLVSIHVPINGRNAFENIAQLACGIPAVKDVSADSHEKSPFVDAIRATRFPESSSMVE